MLIKIRLLKILFYNFHSYKLPFYKVLLSLQKLNQIDF